MSRSSRLTLKNHPLRRTGLRAVASSVGLSSEGVRKWTAKNAVPPEYLAAVVEITQSPPSLLAPDLYRQIAEAEAAWARVRHAG